jgi:hypothetical protein
VSNAETKVFTTDCLLALATSVSHELTENGNKITTKVTIGGQISQCVGEVSATGSDRENLMADNLSIALNAAVEAIEGGAEVIVDGKRVVIASEDEQAEFKQKRDDEQMAAIARGDLTLQ